MSLQSSNGRWVELLLRPSPCHVSPTHQPLSWCPHVRTCPQKMTSRICHSWRHHHCGWGGQTDAYPICPMNCTINQMFTFPHNVCHPDIIYYIHLIIKKKLKWIIKNATQPFKFAIEEVNLNYLKVYYALTKKNLSFAAPVVYQQQ